MVERGHSGEGKAWQELRRQGRTSGGRGGASKVLEGDLSCEKVGKVRVKNGNVKLSEDGMSDNPSMGEFMLEPHVGPSKSREGGNNRRIAMGDGAGPVSESNACHCGEERRDDG